MSDEGPVVAPRKLSLLWILAALVLLCLGWFFLQLFGLKGRIVVSKETTFITEPLGPDGLPDFSAYILERDGAGVTPENNAAVLIWQATWPGDLDPKHWLLIAEALGMEEVPSGQDSLVGVYERAVRTQVGADLTEQFSSTLTGQAAEAELGDSWQERMRDEFAETAINEAMSRPWTDEQMPALAQWVQDNRKPLDLLVEAAARPKYFSPSPSLLDGKKHPLLMHLLPGPQGMRSTVRALTVRAMWHLGEGRSAEAWKDILACLRLARHTSRGSTLIEQLIGIAMDGVACQATVTLLQHDDQGTEQAVKILADLQALPPVSRMAGSLDRGERLFFIDSVIQQVEGKASPNEWSGIEVKSLEVLSLVAIDWNHVLREGNLWYDRFTKATRLPTFAQRQQELSNIEADIGQLSSTAISSGAIVGSVLSRDRRSRMASDVLVSLFLPAVSAATQAEDRAITQQRLTLLAAALATYRMRQGEYPETLDELVPAVLTKLPLDLYTEQPFIYDRKPDGGYLLYSVFENGADDGGTDQNGEIVNGEWVVGEPEVYYENCDIVIRVPEPEFKLPELPMDELEDSEKLDEWEYR